MKKLIYKYSETPDGLFKRLFITFTFGYIPFGIFQAILNMMGVWPLSFNDRNYYGMLSAVVILCSVPLFALLLTVIVWFYFMIGILMMKVARTFLN
ncbi:hypothetical protein [Flavobacterium cerinum]|uniref:DUF4870 domain-containing protein n=1 Tax=Flavobacterium cerinum TaxID=2502784 RepID=A0ABY5IPJ5_9FLAO|nr:hypothetical protein [Flavobacterium cerinum]UUC44165.1 hypothetical protein NOX80_11025 [Flavobacterium cerinum]